MANQKLGFEEFMKAVDSSNKAFVTNLHQEFLTYGCHIQVKEAKSGYVVSYLLDKKAVANFVFRKTGLIIRIYANHINKYMEFLETLPSSMRKSIQTSSICKRLVNPNDCNSKCAMGYDFLLGGVRLQKCRNNAFMFLLCDENNDFIKLFLHKELSMRCQDHTSPLL